MHRNAAQAQRWCVANECGRPSTREAPTCTQPRHTDATIHTDSATSRGYRAFRRSGAGIAGIVVGECRFRERVVTVGVLTFDAEKLAYVCEIRRENGDWLGRLTLGEPKAKSLKQRVLARAERLGLAEIGDVRIDIASVHDYEGSRLGSQAPVGYLLSVDARPVAALELTDANPTFFFQAGLPGDLRRAALVAALGLSVLRDPADSALAD